MLVALTKEASNYEHIMGVNFLPRRNNREDAGLDVRLCNHEKTILPPYSTTKVGLGICISVAEDSALLPDSFTFACIFLPRSSCSGWRLANTAGVIDSGYTGEVFLKLVNDTENPISFEPFEYVAQMLVTPIVLLEPKYGKMPETDRGAKGDGSSGKV
jgi:dUTP pyrophosphatase